MKKVSLFLPILLIIFLIILIPGTESIMSSPQQQVKRMETPAGPMKDQLGFTGSKNIQAQLNIGKFPLYFIPNNGQMDKNAEYYAKASHYTLWLTKEGLIFDSTRKHQKKSDNGSNQSKKSNRQLSSPHLPHLTHSTKLKRDVSRLVYLNANKTPEIIALKETDSKVNYFKGNDKSKWQSGIPTYSTICYKELYKNIDLKVYGVNNLIEYDWIVKPGGNPNEIGFAYKGIDSLSVDKQGNLVIKMDGAEWIHKKPVAFQIINGKQIPVNVNFVKSDSDIYSFGFQIGKYNKKHILTIDPVVMAFSSYLGGSDDDYILGMTIDGNGAIYVTGTTNSSDFPVVNAYDQTYNGTFDIYLAKISSDGTNLVYCTYFGGSGSDGFMSTIEIDSNGYIYLGGTTRSTDLPIVNAIQTTIAGEEDIFLAKFSNDGSSLLFSTYLGGTDFDEIRDIAVNSSGELHAVGITASSDFPTVNALQSNNLNGDAFIVKLSASGTNLVFSTFLGGSDIDMGFSIGVDSYGYIYVGGVTHSTNFPIYNAFQNSPLNMDSVFASKLTANGSSLVYSTYLGGSLYNDFGGLNVTENGLLTIVGHTFSSDFPTTAGTFQSTKPSTTSRSDCYITRFNTSGNLVFSTFLGSNDGGSLCTDVTVGSNGSIYICGRTFSNSFPTLYPIFNLGYFTYCSFITEMQSDGSAINFSSTFPCINVPIGIAVDTAGAIYIAGTNGEENGYHGFQLTSNGNTEGYIAKLIPSTTPYLTVTSPNGGETLMANSTHSITWTGPSTITNIRIDLSARVDDEYIYTTITESTPNTGSFTWNVPNITSDRAGIIVMDADFPALIGDSSDNFFFITQDPLIVTAPNGGETWSHGEVHTITWNSQASVQNVIINYSYDGGNNWIPIAGPITNTNSYNWTVPNTPSANCLIMVTDASTYFTDISNSTFTID